MDTTPFHSLHACCRDGLEELGVLLPQLRVLGNLSRRHGQVVRLRLEASLVGQVGHRVGFAVVTDVGEAALLGERARLRLGARLHAAHLFDGRAVVLLEAVLVVAPLVHVEPLTEDAHLLLGSGHSHGQKSGKHNLKRQCVLSTTRGWHVTVH